MAANLAPQISYATVSVANPNLDGTGTIEQLMVADNVYGLGTLVNSITIKATGSVNAGMIRLFLDDGALGSWHLFREIPIPDVTQTNQYPAYCAVIMIKTLVLPPGALLGVSTEMADTFIVTATGLKIVGYV